MIDLYIKYGTTQPVPPDQVELTHAEVLEALNGYVAARTGGRQVYGIVGIQELFQGGRGAVCSLTLTLKPESK